MANQAPNYICHDCGNPIPLSIAQHREIQAGRRRLPTTCEDCKRTAEYLIESDQYED